MLIVSATSKIVEICAHPVEMRNALKKTRTSPKILAYVVNGTALRYPPRLWIGFLYRTSLSGLKRRAPTNPIDTQLLTYSLYYAGQRAVLVGKMFANLTGSGIMAYFVCFNHVG